MVTGPRFLFEHDGADTRIIQIAQSPDTGGLYIRCAKADIGLIFAGSQQAQQRITGKAVVCVTHQLDGGQAVRYRDVGHDGIPSRAQR